MQRHQLCYHSLVSTNIKTSIRQQLEFEVPPNRKDQDGTNLGRNIIVDANVGFEFEGQKSNFILTRWRWNSLVSTANVSKMPSWDIIGKIMETKRRLDSLELRKKGHFAPRRRHACYVTKTFELIAKQLALVQASFASFPGVNCEYTLDSLFRLWLQPQREWTTNISGQLSRSYAHNTRWMQLIRYWKIKHWDQQNAE